MKNFKFNKELIALITAGTITVTLVGCGLKDNKTDNNEENIETQNSIIYIEDNKEKINLENVIALKSEDQTLFVKYDNLEDKYFTDIFTGAKYYIYHYNTFFGSYFSMNTKKVLEKSNCLIYKKSFNTENITNYIYNATQNIDEYDSYELLKQIFLDVNNIKDCEIDKDNSSDADNSGTISLENVIVLENDIQTLFVKYNDLNDNYFNEIFTNEKIYCNEKIKYIFSVGNCEINNIDYTLNSIALYPNIVSQVKNNNISIEALNKTYTNINSNKQKTLIK